MAGDRRSGGGGRILGKACERAPCFKACGQVLAMQRCAQQVALEREMLADGPEAAQERLSAPRRTKATHAPLTLTSGLVAVLGSVVHAGAGLHEQVLHLGKLRDCALAAG